MSRFLEKLAGRQIAAIEQNADYVQIHLEDATILTVFNSIRSVAPLAQFVGHTIERVALAPGEVLFLISGSTSFSVSVAEEDYRGPEAMSYVGPGGERCVWN